MNSTNTLAPILSKLQMFVSGGMNKGWRILAFTAWPWITLQSQVCTKCISSQVYTNLPFIWNSHLRCRWTGFQSRPNCSLSPPKLPFSPVHMAFDVHRHMEPSRLCQRQQHQGRCRITWGLGQHEGRYPRHWVGCYLRHIIAPSYFLLRSLLIFFCETRHGFLNPQNPQNPYPNPRKPLPSVAGTGWCR